MRGISPIVQTGLLYLIARGIIVLILWSILIQPFTTQLSDENLRSIVSIVIFIIALAFVIGGGKGAMNVGRIFSFRR